MHPAAQPGPRARWNPQEARRDSRAHRGDDFHVCSSAALRERHRPAAAILRCSPYRQPSSHFKGLALCRKFDCGMTAAHKPVRFHTRRDA